MTTIENDNDNSFETWTEEDCAHIAIVSISQEECQCMDCLRIWTKSSDFKSDWPQYDRG